MKKTVGNIFVGLVYFLLYLPLIVMLVFSFNSGRSTSVFQGFSLKWYAELFTNSSDVGIPVRNTLFLAVLSAVIATVIGTAAAVYIFYVRSKTWKNTLNTVTNIPMMNPDIVTGVSMMLLFVAAVGIPFLPITFGRTTMVIAHTTFSLPYVILSVLPRFKQMDKSLTEAALDLGCTPTRAFFKVEFPFIVPGIVSGLMLGFTLSLDDFVISHFVSSPDFQTLPLYIYNQTAHQVKYSMYALCALMVFVILILLFAVNFAGSVGKGKKVKKQREANS